MKVMIFFLSAVWLTQANAAAAEGSFKLLRCPAVPQAYTQILTELTVFKTAIKRDAACNPVQMEVESLESLIGTRRQEVVALVNKNKDLPEGTPEVPLTEQELGEVRRYVEDVSKKVFATADLLDRNKACFSEDNAAFGLAELASITLDATSLAKTVAGPWAAPIAIGGQVIAGFMQGLDKVIKNNKQGYDFTRVEQRQAYMQSLCTYYNYRRDIDQLIFPDDRASDLKKLDYALKSNLQGMINNCVECRQISDLSNRGGDRGAISSLVANANNNFQMPLGSLTVKTLSSLGWVRGELSRIAQDMEGDPVVGSHFVGEIKTSIEDFLFEKEAPRFLQAQNDRSVALFREFRSYVFEESQKILMATAGTVDFPGTALYETETAPLIRYVKMLKPALTAKKEKGLLARISNFERRSGEMLKLTKLSMGVHDSYCDFFQRTGIYSDPTRNECEFGPQKKIQESLAALNTVFPIMEPMVEVNPMDVRLTWEDGLTNFVEQLQANPNLFERKK